jgi:hypothetical protein
MVLMFTVAVKFDMQSACHTTSNVGEYQQLLLRQRLPKLGYAGVARTPYATGEFTWRTSRLTNSDVFPACVEAILAASGGPWHLHRDFLIVCR